MIVGGGMLASLVFQAPPFGWLGSLIVALSIVVALLAYTTGFRWQQHDQPTRFGLLALRLGAVVCLFLTLLHPAWVSEHTFDEKPLLAVVLDDSLSMSHGAGATELRSHEATENGAAGPRTGRARASRYQQAVTILKNELQPAVVNSHRLRVFDVEARNLRIEKLPTDAIGERSPLTDTLLRVKRDLRDEPLIGITLLSDGAEMTDRPVIGDLGQLRVPVHAIDVVRSFQTAEAAADVSIQALSVNRRTLVGNAVRVAVDIAVAGCSDEVQVPVSILDGDHVMASRVLALSPPGESAVRDGRHGRVELEFVPTRPGEFTYTVAVGAQPGEVELANNRATFPLTVRAKPLTVMYIDGVLRWEGKFLREALAADPDINLISTVRTARVGADRGSQGLLLAEQLANVDVVILGDVEASYFSTSEELPALCKWVTESGGGLLVTGGYHSFGPEGAGRTVLRDVLPVEFSASANPQIERPFNLRLTDAGRQHPVFHLSGDRVRDTGFFHKLPPLSGCSRVAGVKPAAEVLAVGPQVGGVAEAGGLPIMVTQQVGAGRTMVFAVDTTWRWRTIVGGFTGDSAFYERFWGQLVRWLASEQEETSRQLFVSTNQSRYRLGETIELNITVNEETRASARAAPRTTAPPPANDRPTASAAWNVRAQTIDENGNRSSIPLADLGDGKYRGTLGAARPGRLDLNVTAEPEQAAGVASECQAQSRVVTVTVDRPDLELLDPRCDPQWLARVAQLTGGRCVQPENIATWASQLPADPVRKTESHSSGAWGDGLFGGAFLVLICCEWILRRRSQLP